MVTKPAILLLDEPLGALDEKLRFDMQSELVDLHKTLGMTFIYITHSQEEALTMSDRIVLMRHGRIEQSGTPQALFDRPTSRFAAEFMGFENFFSGIVSGRREGGRLVVTADGAQIEAVPATPDGYHEGQAVTVAVRAERLTPTLAGAGPRAGNLLPCRPTGHLYRGKYVDRTAASGLGQINIRTWDRAVSDEVFDAVLCRPEDCVVLSAPTN